MAITRSSALRRAVAALFVVVLTLSGVGRATTIADGAPHRLVEIAGVAVEICHSDAGDESGRGDGAHHDCCDACALCAATASPGPAPFSAPERVEHVVVVAAALTWAPVVARIPSPRLSQGPPAA